jgi:pSer/pThr/pTyr-binding forkhead associated (FHA) protein
MAKGSSHSASIELHAPAGRRTVSLDVKELAVGASKENTLVIEDPKVSRLHAVFERFDAGWTVRDLGSRNGTYVNGERIVGSRTLRNEDQVRVGETLLVFRTRQFEGTKSTQAADPSPDLTPRERDVLRALCRPLASGDVFTEPASLTRIAAELVVTEEAVKQHLRNLYAKFDLNERADRRRRVRLANEALRRGAITLGELRT